MKKIISATLLSVILAANVFVASGQYCSRTSSSSSARYLKSVNFTGTGVTSSAVNISTSGNSKIYYDKTSNIVYAETGSDITPNINYSGDWMQGYVYIDYDKNGVFNTDNEMVAFSGYVIDGVWKNSKGQTFSDGNACKPGTTPSFTIPSSVEAGDYRLRVKADWDSPDPCGRTSATGNSMEQNGGAIVDLTIRITKGEPSYKITFSDNYSYGWKLDWTEEFDKGAIDETVWSKIAPYEGSNPDWRKNISTYDGCFDFRDGNIVLKGIRNPGQSITGDTRTYLCGGIQSMHKKAFMRGKIEISAKFGSAQGAWPALWMMPEDESAGWPGCGEIDIMEHLNYENIAYQTLHSNYTYDVSKENPLSHVTPYINKSIYNTYGVEMGEDTLKLLVNGTVNMEYPRTGATDQFPFDKEFYLILDMQLGGSWVGNVTGADIPVEMLIDWVKFYKRDEKGGKLSVYKGATPIKSGDNVREGDNITVTANPVTGYEVDKVFVNGTDVTGEYLASGSYSFEASQNTTISATYKVQQCAVQYTANGGGAITVTGDKGNTIGNGASLGYGENVNIEFSPKSGETIESYKVNGSNRLASVTGNKDSFPLSGDAAIEVQFSGESGVETSVTDNVAVYTDRSNIIIITQSAAKADIFNAAGVLVNSLSLQGTTSIPCAAGIYLIKIDGKTYKVKI